MVKLFPWYICGIIRINVIICATLLAPEILIAINAILSGSIWISTFSQVRSTPECIGLESYILRLACFKLVSNDKFMTSFWRVYDKFKTSFWIRIDKIAIIFLTIQCLSKERVYGMFRTTIYFQFVSAFRNKIQNFNQNISNLHHALPKS